MALEAVKRGREIQRRSGAGTPSAGTTGRADVMLDAVMHPWDCAALVPILAEAGGTFTDWTGRTTIHGGDALSTNGLLLDAVLGELSDTR